MRKLLLLLLVVAVVTLTPLRAATTKPPTVLSDSRAEGVIPLGDTTDVAALTLTPGRWLLVGHITALVPASPTGSTDVSILLAGVQSYWTLGPRQSVSVNLSVPVTVTETTRIPLQAVVGWDDAVFAGTRFLWALPQ